MTTPLGWPFPASPFHPGEQAIQSRLGVRDRIEAGGRRLVRDFLPEQHREFFAELPFLVVGMVDGHGQPWAAILAGEPGFVSSPDPKTLRISTRPLTGDPLATALKHGSAIGVIGLDFAARRRNRANGIVSAIDDHGFDIAVTQCYGNCPKYIQTRSWEAAPKLLEDAAETRSGPKLERADAVLIARADTFFVASTSGTSSNDPSHGADASHRGGKPGFVRVDDEKTLTVPDFIGNFAFNTLGNLLVEPRCGLLVLDFETGTTLQIAARAEIIWEGSEVELVPDAERLVRFHITHVRRCERIVPLRWRLLDSTR
jgi:predicted pyridoxine 5'-phosphate oxidase superfamily flavin-nucleotide-binding protein